MIAYRTKDGDTADLIAWLHYRTTDNRVVEQLLDANPGLADLGPILSAGIIVLLPDIVPSHQPQGVRLWD